MAIEHEIDRMVVRLVGDQKQYQDMLKDVEKSTDESAKYAEKQASKISRAFSTAFKSVQGLLKTTGSTVRDAGLSMSAAGAAISAPLGKAALDFGGYGKSVNDLVKESEKAAKAAADMKKEVMQGTEAYKELNKVVKLTEKQASVFKLMSERTGESITDLTKTVTTSSEEFKKWEKEAKDLGLLLGKDLVKSANELSESWIRTKQATKGMWIQLGAAVAPLATELNDLFIGVLKWVNNWISENKELIATIGNIAEKLVVVGGVLTAIGTGLMTLSSVLGPIVATITAGVAAWLAWDTATGKVLREGASGVWARYSSQIKETAKTVLDYGKRIVDYTSDVMDGVFNAVKAGNLELAVDILWTGAKVAWASALDELDAITGERFSSIFQNLAAGNWKDSLDAAIAEVSILFKKLQLKVGPVWIEISKKAQEAWTDIVNWADESKVKIQNTLDNVMAHFADAVVTIRSKWEYLKQFFKGFVGFFEAVWRATLGRVTEAFGTFFGFAHKGFMTMASALGKTLDAILGDGSESPKMKRLIEDSGKFEKIMERAGKDIDKDVNITTNLEIAEKRIAEREKGLYGDEEDEDNIGRIAERNKKLAEDHATRVNALASTQIRLMREIRDLEEQRVKFQEKGKQEAADKLEAEIKTLEALKAQAAEEEKLAREQRANAEITAEESRLKIQAAQTELRLDQQRQRIIESYDPVAKYMRQLKELNNLFDEGKRSPEVYKKAIKDVEHELATASLNAEVNFAVTGMDAVRQGSREELELVQNTMAALEKEKALKEAKSEAERRQRELDAQQERELAEHFAGGMQDADEVIRNRDNNDALEQFWGGSMQDADPKPVEAGLPGQAGTDDKTEKLIDSNERTAIATEKMADAPKIELVPLGAM